MEDKRPGVANMLTCMLGIMFLFTILFFGMDMFDRLRLAIDKSRLERSFMLSMESEGYLTKERQEALLNELNSLGVRNVSFLGTTLSPVGYGSEIVLCVTGDIEYNGITGLSDAFKFVRGGTCEFRIYQKSTAKY